MAEYVLKEDILKYLEKKSSIEISTNSVIGKDISRAIDVLYYDIGNMPAANVQPVKRGKWEGVDYDTFFKCSECGHMTDWQRYKYCPYCGTRMIKDGDTE